MVEALQDRLGRPTFRSVICEPTNRYQPQRHFGVRPDGRRLMNIGKWSLSRGRTRENFLSRRVLIVGRSLGRSNPGERSCSPCSLARKRLALDGLIGSSRSGWPSSSASPGKLAQHGQQARPHALRPSAGSRDPHSDQDGDQRDKDRILNKRRATLVAPETLQHTHTPFFPVTLVRGGHARWRHSAAPCTKKLHDQDRSVCTRLLALGPPHTPWGDGSLPAGPSG
jgi:hypothetical protein